MLNLKDSGELKRHLKNPRTCPAVGLHISAGLLFGTLSSLVFMITFGVFRYSNPDLVLETDLNDGSTGLHCFMVRDS